MCFVLGRIFGHLTISMQELLSSNIVQCIFGFSMGISSTKESSFNRDIMGMASLMEWDSAIYLLSVEDREISDWSFDNHMTAHPAYLIRNPVRENTDEGSELQDLFQSPAKDASTKTSILFDLSILNSKP